MKYYEYDDDTVSFEEEKQWNTSDEKLVKCKTCKRKVPKEYLICPFCGSKFVEDEYEEIEEIRKLQTCPICKKILSSETKICPFCGAFIIKQDDHPSPTPTINLSQKSQQDSRDVLTFNISKNGLILLEKLALKGLEGITSRKLEQINEVNANPFVEIKQLINMDLVKQIRKRTGERVFYITPTGHQVLEYFHERIEGRNN